MTAGELLAACALDALFGDPRWLPHPVRAMGRAVEWYEAKVRNWTTTARAERIAGLVLALGLPAISYAAGWWILELAGRLHGMAERIAVVVLSYTTLAGRDLVDHARRVAQALECGTLSQARKAVGQIVGRDTERLSEAEVVRATVETVAESTCDGIIAPLFYLIIGGPPLALAYKAVNTLDSMVGHRDTRYRYFGWASARLDDIANWVPARMAALLLVCAAVFVRQPTEQAWRILRRDGRKHPSPNSGRPEAAMAGALGVRLGGTNFYDGIPSERPYLGEVVVPLSLRHIYQALHLAVGATVLAIAFGALALSV